MDMIQQFKDRMYDIRKRINDNEVQRDRDNSDLEKTIIKYCGRTEALRLKLNVPVPQPIRVQQVSKADTLKQSLMPKPKEMFVAPQNNKQRWPKHLSKKFKL